MPARFLPAHDLIRLSGSATRVPLSSLRPLGNRRRAFLPSYASSALAYEERPCFSEMCDREARAVLVLLTRPVFYSLGASGVVCIGPLRSIPWLRNIHPSSPPYPAGFSHSQYQDTSANAIPLSSLFYSVSSFHFLHVGQNFGSPPYPNTVPTPTRSASRSRTPTLWLTRKWRRPPTSSFRTEGSERLGWTDSDDVASR
jgi:hypothetical protein